MFHILETGNKSMSDKLFAHPILNSPYKYPTQHWELNESGQPTQKVIDNRRTVDFITPITRTTKRKEVVQQVEMVLDEGKGLSTKDQQYQIADIINRIRKNVEQWRQIQDSNLWKVTPETVRLLKHLRDYEFLNLRPFFCQIEASNAT